MLDQISALSLYPSPPLGRAILAGVGGTQPSESVHHQSMPVGSSMVSNSALVQLGDDMLHFSSALSLGSAPTASQKDLSVITSNLVCQG